jgi:hypothetical protein
METFFLFLARHDWETSGGERINLNAIHAPEPALEMFNDGTRWNLWNYRWHDEVARALLLRMICLFRFFCSCRGEFSNFFCVILYVLGRVMTIVIEEMLGRWRVCSS